MGYMHIENLYKDARILEFKHVYALCKIHGSSAHITWKDGHVLFSPGGVSHDSFVAIFDQEKLAERFANCGSPHVTVFGEVYGGKCQGMKATYGDKLRFVAFEVRIDDLWLAVPQAEAFVLELGLEFVHYKLVSTDMDALNAERDADSVQAVRNGMGEGHMREGIVLRPPFEVRLNNGERLIAKHKREDFSETKTPRIVGVAPEVLADARQVADEWVTPMRLTHVLQRLPGATGMEHTKDVVAAMTEDVLREGAGEIVDSKAVRKEIGKATVALWKRRIAEKRNDDE
jgi:hypothetical protein